MIFLFKFNIKIVLYSNKRIYKTIFFILIALFLSFLFDMKKTIFNFSDIQITQIK